MFARNDSENRMKKSIAISSLCILLSLASCNKANSQQKDTKAAPQASKQNNTQVLSALSKEQQEAVKLLIRDTLVSNPEILLEAQQAYEAKMSRQQNELAAKAYTKIIAEANELSFGPKDAKVTIVEFFDYKCGFCHAANPWLTQKMNDKNIRVIFKELPILSQNSVLASKAAIAAHNQGKYVELHRALMLATGDLSIGQIMSIAQNAGLDVKKLEADMNSEKISKMLETVKTQAEDAGISGTPGFLINGKLIAGFAKEELEATIGAALQ